MIAVAVSAFVALYILGPDAVSRVILGFTIPRRTLTLTRSEEVTRALIWSILSCLIAYFWCRADSTWSRVWQPAALRTCFAGLYSEEFFRTHQDLWFSSLHPLFALNLNLLSRLYATVLVLSAVLSVLTHYYGVIRDRLPPWTWLRGIFAAVVLPRVAPWHTLLSKLLLGDRDLLLMADILTKSDKLYQGELTDKLLAADGSLVSLTLADPRRFDRPAYLKAKDSLPKPSSQDFWKASLRTFSSSWPRTSTPSISAMSRVTAA